jgi:diguanylate cyclase (GGDEF)-like protein
MIRLVPIRSPDIGASAPQPFEPTREPSPALVAFAASEAPTLASGAPDGAFDRRTGPPPNTVVRTLRLDAPAVRAAATGRPRGRAHVHHLDAHAAPVARTGPLHLPWDAAIGAWDAVLSTARAGELEFGNWEALLSAVKARLRSSVDERLAVPDDGHGTAARVRAQVLECVAALEHLHTILTRELVRCRQLRQAVLAAQAALAQARTELAGTRVGERRARHQAMHDSLTSLPNRRHFLERLDQALVQDDARHPALAVLFLDLDGFKPINDTHGHDTGDKLLQIVAARLARAIRAGDLVSRLGGDEFACLLTGALGRDQLSLLARKLIDAVAAPLTIGTLGLTVRPSIGIALCPTDGASAESLLRNADIAMFRAKRRQGGHAFFDEVAGA